MINVILFFIKNKLKGGVLLYEKSSVEIIIKFTVIEKKDNSFVRDLSPYWLSFIENSL